MIRELPRGPFGAYLRAHYLGVPGMMSRFAMGCGAIFMIQRVRPQTESLMAQGAIAETDPLLLEEMVNLVLEQGLEVVGLPELPARLAARDRSKRFVSFTFDGAYKATLDTVVPLFRARRLPYTVFVAGDFLDSGTLPWWLGLEALIAQCAKIRIYSDHKADDFACAGDAEKRDCYARLFRQFMQMPSAERAEHVALLCAQHNVDLAAVAAKEMLSSAALKTLAQDPLVTIGSQGGGIRPLSEMGYDEARDDLARGLDTVEAAIGARPLHIAYPGTHPQNAGAREFKLATGLGVETAVTAIEGALWPEHAAEPFALPRIALDNDPATLVRALMLSGGGPFSAGAPGPIKAIA